MTSSDRLRKASLGVGLLRRDGGYAGDRATGQRRLAPLSIWQLQPIWQPVMGGGAGMGTGGQRRCINRAV